MLVLVSTYLQDALYDERKNDKCMYLFIYIYLHVILYWMGLGHTQQSG